MPIKTILQQAALSVYGTVARTGIMKQPRARRLFLAAYWAYKKWIEAGPVDRLKDLVTPGSTVVDVGANVGFFTLKFARWVGEPGQVIAIEPDVENFEMLAAKVGAAGFEQRVRLHQAVATAEAGYAHFQRNELHPGDHRITLGDGGIVVSAVTVDDLVFAAGGQSVSLVKVDVQGAEMLVLAGAKRTLAEIRPTLFVEVDDNALLAFGSSASALVAYVEGAGYQMYELTSDGAPRKLAPDRLFAKLKGGSYIDVLFLPA